MTRETFSNELLRASLNTNTLEKISSLVILPSVDSTNSYLLRVAAAGEKKNVMCVAEMQTHGRGRRGNPWVAPLSTNLYFSLLWHFSCPVSALSGINLVVGVSMAEAVDIVAPTLQLELKWPNDLLIRHHKLGGTLIEIASENPEACAAVIGIGINIAMPTEATLHLQRRITDISRECGAVISKNHLAAVLLNRLVSNLAQFEREGTAHFVDAWQRRDVLQGQAIKVTLPQETLEGVAESVTPQGELQLKLVDGSVRKIHAGEAHLGEIG